MLLFHEFEGTGYFSQVNEHSSGRVKKPDNGLATAIYLHMYMHVLCMYFVVLYFIDLPNKQTNTIPTFKISFAIISLDTWKPESSYYRVLQRLQYKP